MTVPPTVRRLEADQLPLVSVVLPVHNGAATLAASIDSLLQQTLERIEIIAVDDGSNDETPAILRSYTGDPRLRVVTQAASGIVAALNAGVAQARGDYIARLDADDLAYAERLERQLHTFLRSPRLVLLGTAMDVIDMQGRRVGELRYRTTDGALRRQLRKRNPFVHSSVMMRRQAVLDVGGYRRMLQLAEDYDLWLRLADRGLIGNLPNVGGAYRRSDRSLSARSALRQAFAFAAARRCAELRRTQGNDPITVQGDPLVHTLSEKIPCPWLAQEHAFYSLLQRFEDPAGEVSDLDGELLGKMARRMTSTERRLAQDALERHLRGGPTARRSWHFRTALRYFWLDPWRAAIGRKRRTRRDAA